ncbi:MAG: delta-aminolevulinic acid dehydratase [Spirulina sp. SIO3F2]|nr:delta-aminolevulinic acid dehydratase [Spirulina sp. SIO3F2]
MTFINSEQWHTWVDMFCTILFFCTVVLAFWFASRMD